MPKHVLRVLAANHPPLAESEFPALTEFLPGGLGKTYRRPGFNLSNKQPIYIYISKYGTLETYGNGRVFFFQVAAAILLARLVWRSHLRHPGPGSWAGNS